MAVSLFGKWQLPGHVNFDWLSASRPFTKYNGEKIYLKDQHMFFNNQDLANICRVIFSLWQRVKVLNR